MVTLAGTLHSRWPSWAGGAGTAAVHRTSSGEANARRRERRPGVMAMEFLPGMGGVLPPWPSPVSRQFVSWCETVAAGRQAREVEGVGVGQLFDCGSRRTWML